MEEYKAKVILVDIEGTTTSISFVKDILFPYAKEHCHAFLERTWSELTTCSIVDDLKNLPEYTEFIANTNQKEDDSMPNLECITDFVHHLIQKDLKLKPLKTLQGLIWENGYKDGTLKGHVFDDVPDAFKRWHENDLRVAVYSSGSIWAQKLLFGETICGNLLPYLSAHFDTTSGLKTEKQSYRKIAQELGVDANDVLFLTDITKEAAAAIEAGMQSVILNRPGNAPLTDDEKATYNVIQNFDELKVQTSFEHHYYL